MAFNPEMALAYARAMARPRRVGCGEDDVVACELAERLEHFGYNVERQPFCFSAVLNVWITAEILITLLFILLTLWAQTISAWAALIPVMLIVLILISFERLNRAVQTHCISSGPGGATRPRQTWLSRLGRQHITANLVATLPGIPSDSSLPQLYLMAHYDSKSQVIPLGVRMALVVIAIIGSILFVGLTVLGLFYPGLSPAITALGIALLIISLPLLFLDAGNASPGAIDNASGVGLVLHLAECLAARPDLRDQLAVTILLTSAEEFGVMGSTAYVRQNVNHLRQQAQAGELYILNFDGVGVDGKLHYTDVGRANHRAQPSRLTNLLRQACAELQLPIKRFSLAGALYDHLPFAQRGFDAVTLLTIGRTSWSVHTPGDTADKLHMRGFEQTGLVALKVVEKLGTLRGN